MATVIAVYSYTGCVGRCDANCHHAKSLECTCICGGANHGQGLKRAIANTERRIGMSPAALNMYAEIKNITEPLVVLDRVVVKSRGVALKRARRMISEPEFPWWEEKVTNAV